MKEILFDPNGGPLTVRIKYDGIIIAEYTYRLRESNSNGTVQTATGDNDNEEDDLYHLPIPVKSNHNRKITVGSDFASADGSQGKTKWKTNVIVFQDGEELDMGTDSGTYPAEDQSFVIIKLKAQEE